MIKETRAYAQNNKIQILEKKFLLLDPKFSTSSTSVSFHSGNVCLFLELILQFDGLLGIREIKTLRHSRMHGRDTISCELVHISHAKMINK